MIVGVATPLFTYTWLLYQLLLWDESLGMVMKMLLKTKILNTVNSQIPVDVFGHTPHEYE